MKRLEVTLDQLTSEWGQLRVGGGAVMVRSPSGKWPRCTSCDSRRCWHMQTMYRQLGKHGLPSFIKGADE